MFPNSSIKRLRFAFMAMAGLTLLALLVGSGTFFHGRQTQQRFLAEAAPLLVSVQELSNTMVRFSETSRRLETIRRPAQLKLVLARQRDLNDKLGQALLNLARQQPDAQATNNLSKAAQTLKDLEDPFAEALHARIHATTRLIELRREIDSEGLAMLDRLAPFSLQTSLALINLYEQQIEQGSTTPEALSQAVSDLQQLADIGIAAERLLLDMHDDLADDQVVQGPGVDEEIALGLGRLEGLVGALRNQTIQQSLTNSIRVLSEKALASGGLVDQRERRAEAALSVETLSQERLVVLTRMTDLVNELVIETREAFDQSAKAAERSSLIAVFTLAGLSVIAFFAVIWIGRRLIDRDIAKRLERLAQSTIALADGDLDVVIDQTGSDELAGMARATETFRQNALELRRAKAELAEQLVDVEKANDKLQLVNTALDSVNAELAESEQRYQLAITGSSSGIWDWNAKTDTLFWSDRMKEIAGVTEQTFVPKQSFSLDRLHPDDINLLMERRQRHLEHGAPYRVECRLLRDDGAYVWVHIRGQAVWDDHGELVRMAGSATDISDRKSAEIKLIAYAQELERSNRELDDFAYIASHDLREPLRAIYNHATFLIEDYQGKLGEDGERRLKRLVKLGKRMEKLIADLLYFSRLGRGELTTETIDLNAVIVDIEGNLAEMLKARHARIDLPDHLPTISGHPAQIVTLLQNLICNGVIYNDAEDKAIEIGIASSEAEEEPTGDGSFATFYVRDNGIGIDKQFQDEVFRIFKRLNSEKAYGEGTGAGLTFVRKIIENHGGRIWISSEAGEGATVFFTLPIRTGQSAAAADDAAA